MTAAHIAAGASIKHSSDHALVFSAQLSSHGLKIENGTERQAFLQCLAESEQFWAAHDGLGQAKFAARDAIAQIILLSDLIFGENLCATRLEPDAMGNPDVGSPAMDCAA